LRLRRRFLRSSSVDTSGVRYIGSPSRLRYFLVPSRCNEDGAEFEFESSGVLLKVVALILRSGVGFGRFGLFETDGRGC
jgi:hypothetical protein